MIYIPEGWGETSSAGLRLGGTGDRGCQASWPCCRQHGGGQHLSWLLPVPSLPAPGGTAPVQQSLEACCWRWHGQRSLPEVRKVCVASAYDNWNLLYDKWDPSIIFWPVLPSVLVYRKSLGGDGVKRSIEGKGGRQGCKGGVAYYIAGGWKCFFMLCLTDFKLCSDGKSLGTATNS